MFGEDTQIEEDVSKALKKKSEKSGISAKTLRTVYNRGVAAWRTGHRALHLNSGVWHVLMHLLLKEKRWFKPR